MSRSLTHTSTVARLEVRNRPSSSFCYADTGEKIFYFVPAPVTNHLSTLTAVDIIQAKETSFSVLYTL